MSPLHYRFEQTLAWHCAPSLAGIKAADLLTWTVEGREGADLLSHYAGMLSSRGVRLYVLGSRRGRTLLLIFRPRQLDRWLAQPRVQEMLDRAGYPVSQGTEAMLAHLRRRLQGGEFPHEIGLFLGYPPEMWRAFSGTVAATASCAAPGRYMTTWRRPPGALPPSTAAGTR